jgi:hypothetical protein
MSGHDAFMDLVKQLEAQTELALARLKQSFDERLVVFQGRFATTRLLSIIRGPAKLVGRVKAGSVTNDAGRSRMRTADPQNTSATCQDRVNRHRALTGRQRPI